MKELPYFKFYCNEWITGDVSFLDFEVQGLFVNLCAFYWSKKGKIKLANAKRKFTEIKADAFEILINSGVIKVSQDEDIIINFLDEQMTDMLNISKIKSINGSLGGRPKKEIEIEPKKEVDVSLKKVESNFNFKKELIKKGVSLKLADEWMLVRKNKKATNTLKAFNSIMKEIEKSNLTVEECIRIAVEKSWSGFNNDWLKNISSKVNTNQKSTHNNSGDGIDWDNEIQKIHGNNGN